MKRTYPHYCGNMGAYHYTAINKAGSTVKGVVEADSQWHARQLVRDLGLLPTGVVPAKKHTSSHALGKLSPQDLCLVTRQLATLIAAGIPLDEALTGVAEQTTLEKTRAIMINVRAKVLEGFSLAEALGNYPKAFPEIYCATVSAGEQTGKLDIILEHLADYTEAQQANRQRVVQALIYPIAMLTVSLGIIIFLLNFVVPKIIDVFSESGQILPLMTVILIKISEGVQNYSLYGVMIFALLIYSFVQSLKSTAFRYRWHFFLLKLPLISKIERYINLSRYIHTFSMLFEAGVGVIETMKVSASVVKNLPMYDAFSKATLKVQEGMPIHQAMKETEYLTPMALHLIANGEKSSRLPSMMSRAANQLDDEVRRMIDTGLTLLEPIVIFFMGGVVLFIVLATLLPIFSMEQLVS